MQRSKTALGATYRRIARRRIAPQAVFVVARKIATYVYRLLRYGSEYVDIGQAAYDQRFRSRRIAALKTNARELGFELVPNAQPG